LILLAKEAAFKLAAALTHFDEKDERFFLFSDILEKEEVVVKDKKKSRYEPQTRNFIKENKKVIKDMQKQIEYQV